MSFISVQNWEKERKETISCAAAVKIVTSSEYSEQERQGSDKDN